MPSLDHILQLILAYRYLIIFPIAVVEGPIIAILSGFLVSRGALNMYVVYVLLVLGDLVGDTIYYLIGRWGGNAFVRRHGHFFGLREEHLIAFEEGFRRHSTKLLLFGKTQAIGSVTLAAAGITKMPYLRFLFISAIGTTIKIFLLLLIGFYFGQAYGTINTYLSRIAIISSFAVVIAIVVFVLYRRKKQ